MTYAAFIGLKNLENTCQKEILPRQINLPKIVLTTLGLDILLFISVLAIAILSENNVVSMPPAGTYTFYGIAGLILLPNIAVIGYSKWRNHQEKKRLLREI